MSLADIDLDHICEEDLLKLRISVLPLKIEGTWLEECIQQLYSELEGKGIAFRPECYLADEWLTPENETCIGVPFYLAHPALIRLERKFMIDAEGETKSWCMKLLRHEAGHALCYACRFHRRKKWRKIFGPSSQQYTDTYKFRPYSKNYVRHLEGYYAQYHPDEDFVETFAVWLTPGMDWRAQYKGWKALDKLLYVEQLIQEIKGREPPVKSRRKFWRLSTLNITLNNYYKKKRHYWAEEFPDFHDNFLVGVFEQKRSQTPQTRAAGVIGKFRRQIVNSVSHFSGEKKHVVSDLLNDVQKRSRELDLYAVGDDSFFVMHLTAYITALIMNYLYTGKFTGNARIRR